MNRCLEHGLDHADDAECPQCRRLRQRAEAVEALMGFEAPQPHPIEPGQRSMVMPLAVPVLMPVPEVAAAKVADPSTAGPSLEEAARIEDEIRRMEADAGIAPDTVPLVDTGRVDDVSTPVAAEAERDVLERFNDTAAAAATAMSSPVRASDPEMSAARIQELIDQNANVVGLLGFPGAGKTWFLNRLKFELFTSREDRHEAIPPHAAQWDSVGRTNGVTEHFFRSDAYDAPSSFYVIDIPGERFISLAEGRFLGRERELLALKACKALIIVVPADEVLLGERASALFSRPGAGTETTGDLEKQARALAAENGRLERFTANIARLNVVLSLLSQNIEVSKIAAMTSEDLVRHLDSEAFKPSSKPVFVALSKADVIEAQAVATHEGTGDGTASVMDLLYRGLSADLEALQEFDRDPEEIVDRYRPALARAVNAFRWSKFDFVTAFRGHGDGGVSGTVVDYTLGRRGVAAVLRWMEWARASDTGLTAADWRAIAVARALRRFRNQGRFRRPRKTDQFR